MPRAFVIRPFGKKTDSAGKQIDFDRTHQLLIAPALEAAGLGGELRPDRRRLQVLPGRDLAVGPRERLGIDRVDVAVVVDQPVAALAALFGPPLPVDEARGVEREPHGDHELVGLLAVAQARAHGRG